MPRAARHYLNPKSVLVGLVLLCVLFSITPPRWTRWQSQFAQPARTILLPISHPLYQLVGGPEIETPRGGLDPAAVQALQQQRDELLAQKLQLDRENESLRGVIRDLQRGIDINPGLAVRQVTAPVLGTSTDLSARVLTIRAGRRAGVLPRAVVAARGVHLVGQVVSVTDRLATVQTIADRSAPRLIGVVMLREDFPGPICQLHERRGSDLIFTVGDGEFLDPATSLPIPIDQGMLVRLRDDAWPLYAEGLIVGRVVSADVNPEIRQRRMITVRPEVDFSTLREVQIRSLDDAAPLPFSDARRTRVNAAEVTP
ncbi:MAG: hypothetical protein KF768_08895 [Phycisphaeraceae bacterium]|nr:hypothetical protein [Phycisphaeraceae bacterium]